MKINNSILFLLLIIIVASTLCASAPSQLITEELSVIESAIRNEINSSDVWTRRPIVILDTTDNWMPKNDVEEDLSKHPPEVRQQISEQIEPKRIPKELRSNNHKRYSLKGLSIPNNVSLYSASDFNKRYLNKNEALFRELVLNLGGKEPYVLSVSRPYIGSDGKAILLLHALSTWSGCGGLDVVHLTRSDEGWVVNESALLIIW